MEIDGRVDAVRSTLASMLDAIRKARETMRMPPSVDRAWTNTLREPDAEAVALALDELERVINAAWTELGLEARETPVARELDTLASFVWMWLKDLEPIALSRTYGRHESGITDEALRAHMEAVERANQALRAVLHKAERESEP